LVNSSIESVPDTAISGSVPTRKEAAISSGRIIVNADDWGRNEETTQRTLECVQLGAVSSVSAMVFTEDSERAAALAREHGVDAGLHLNFTSPFLSANCPTRLLEHQHAVARYLTRNPFARGVYNPWLVRSFEYVVAAQIEEYVRLYGAAPERLDGHHHMHLSANVLVGGLLPHGTIVRRHFSYESREKPLRHRIFRRVTDALLKDHFRLADYFFPLIPLEPAARLREIFQLGGRAVVEVETHPVNPGEYQFLAGGEIFRLAGDSPIARSYEIPKRNSIQ
jgi:chitin disaccharide deacetylase